MEPVLAVLIGCLIYVAVFILVSWLKDIFTWRKQICGVYTVFCYAQHTQEVLICIDGIKEERMIKMIELTNAGYILLIVLSVEFGYVVHGVVDAIKDGTFFD